MEEWERRVDCDNKFLQCGPWFGHESHERSSFLVSWIKSFWIQGGGEKKGVKKERERKRDFDKPK